MRVALLAILLLLQAPHEGQPESCNNYHTNTHKCECARAHSCDGKERNEDSVLDGSGKHARCQTYCRKSHCHCLGPCTT